MRALGITAYCIKPVQLNQRSTYPYVVYIRMLVRLYFARTYIGTSACIASSVEASPDLHTYVGICLLFALHFCALVRDNFLGVFNIFSH